MPFGQHLVHRGVVPTDALGELPGSLQLGPVGPALGPRAARGLGWESRKARFAQAGAVRRGQPLMVRIWARGTQVGCTHFGQGRHAMASRGAR